MFSFLQKDNKLFYDTELLNQRINYTLTNWLHTRKNTPKPNTTSREELNSKFKGENFILQNNQRINSFLTQEKNHKKSVIITTRRPNKNSGIISAHHINKRPFDRYQFDVMAPNTFVSPNRNELSNLINPGSTENVFNTEHTNAVTTTTMPSTTTNIQIYSTTKPIDNNWSIFEFLKNIIQLG